MVHVDVELFGGLELLTQDGSSQHKLEVLKELSNISQPVTLSDLVAAVSKNLIQDPLMFSVKDTEVRPGILVLVNDCDWEVLEKYNTELREGDRVTFVSTLHGG
eukprot:Lankesteria_metandrocarpae@DN5316_c3_g1_i2.p5